jgi:glycosyltransferase involved in cell wall biosynthesis
MVANLHHKKDHSTLIRAWRRVRDEWQLPGRPCLLLAGAHHGEYRNLLQLVEELGLQEEVRFLGEVHEMGALLGATDLAVFSSHNEGIPNAVLEAMGFGLAVVATDCAAIRETVGPEGTMLLAPANDPETLARKIQQAAGDPQLRVRLGAYGRERVATAFGVEQMGRRMTDIIAAEWQKRRTPARLAQLRSNPMPGRHPLQ